MKKSNFRLIGYITMILGVAFVFAGWFAASISEYSFGCFGQGSGYQYPYAQYGIGLIMCGIVLEIISALMYRASKAIPTPA